MDPNGPPSKVASQFHGVRWFWLYNKKTKLGAMQNIDILFDASLSTLKGGQSQRRFVNTNKNQVNYGRA